MLSFVRLGKGDVCSVGKVMGSWANLLILKIAVKFSPRNKWIRHSSGFPGKRISILLWIGSTSVNTIPSFLLLKSTIFRNRLWKWNKARKWVLRIVYVYIRNHKLWKWNVINARTLVRREHKLWSYPQIFWFYIWNSFGWQTMEVFLDLSNWMSI